LERKLKIVFLASNDHQTDQRMRRICSSLHNAGHEVHLVGRRLSKESRQEVASYTIHLLPLRHSKGPRFYFNLMQSQIAFVRKIKNVDIVSSVDADTIIAASKLSKILSAIHIHDAHEWFTEVPELKGKIVKKAIWKWVERKGLKTTRAAYTVSQTLKKYYDQIAPVPFDLIRNYPKSLEVTERSLKKYDIIYQGAINQGRCIELLLEVCKKESYSLCLCGNGDLYSSLKEKYKKVTHIEFKGAILPENLHRITETARIGFNMLDNSSQSYDGSLPNKTFDYIQAQIPQIISASTELKELNALSEFGLICEVNYESLNNGIKTLLTDITLKTALEKNIKELRKQFIWEIQEQQLIKIYEQNA